MDKLWQWSRSRSLARCPLRKSDSEVCLQALHNSRAEVVPVPANRWRARSCSTPRFKLTPEGAEYYERCVHILAKIAESEVTLACSGNGPGGKLYVNMVGSIGRLLATPQLHAFHSRYPDIDLLIGCDRPADLSRNGVHCAIRMGTFEDSRVIARTLEDMRVLTVASPTYLASLGVLRTLSVCS